MNIIEQEKENLRLIFAKAVAFDKLFVDKKITEDAYIDYLQKSQCELAQTQKMIEDEEKAYKGENIA